MTEEKDTIIDAEFSETKQNTESDETSLVVPKQPGKPAPADRQSKESNSYNYLHVVAYVVFLFALLAITGLYLRGMFLVV